LICFSKHCRSGRIIIGIDPMIWSQLDEILVSQEDDLFGKDHPLAPLAFIIGLDPMIWSQLKRDSRVEHDYDQFEKGHHLPPLAVIIGLDPMIP
jgi:hypothetical protein